ncbi:Bgt-1130, partial [Blumeria graminis f. sp. tritici]
TATAVSTELDEDEFEGFSDNASIKDTREKKLAVPFSQMPSKKQISRKEKAVKNTTKDPAITKETKENLFSSLLDIADTADIDLSGWVALDLSSSLLSALSKLGFPKPTVIQSTAIPEILAGHDVVGKASTGSGKTLAFAIPIVESWLEANHKVNMSEDTKSRLPIALILSPTRELAHQLTTHIKCLCQDFPNPLNIATVTGGLSIQKQHRQISNADIIIGTPGRLWEVISSDQKILEAFQHVKFLVIDEADRLLTEGHFKEVEDILNALDRQQSHDQASDEEERSLSTRQTLVFSATFDKGLQQKLTGKGKQGMVNESNSMEYLLRKLNFREDNPKFIDANPNSQMASGLKEGIIECSGIEKDLYLYALLLYHPNQRTLVFTNSIHSVKRLTPMLQNLGLPAQSLHSQMAQKARLRAIERFGSSKATGQILVATDVAARGLDVGGMQLIIHYHLPRTADMYVHRSGRTARAEASGTSILMCAPEEVVGTRRLVAKVHAQNVISSGSKLKNYLKSLDIDRKVVARLKPRMMLAKQIADSVIAKEKKGHDDEWLKSAAEELGVDYDSEEFEATGRESKGRGTGRKLKEKKARNMSKDEVNSLRRELKLLLEQRVNVGVSERYLTSGTVNVNELLRGVKGEFLGAVDDIGIDYE